MLYPLCNKLKIEIVILQIPYFTQEPCARDLKSGVGWGVGGCCSLQFYADINSMHLISNHQYREQLYLNFNHHIPSSPADLTSTLSYPLPILTMTRKLLNFSKSSLAKVMVCHIRAPTASFNTCGRKTSHSYTVNQHTISYEFFQC